MCGGGWGEGIDPAVFRVENQQGPAAQHRALCSMLCGSRDGRGVGGRRDTWVCMAEALVHLNLSQHH